MNHLAPVFFALGVSVSALALSCGAVPSKSPVVSQHSHKVALAGESCSDLCWPGSCASAWSLSAQAETYCEDLSGSLCICTPPKD